MDKVERRLEDVIAIGAPDMYSAGNPVQATTTTLLELQVFPQPVAEAASADLGAGDEFPLAEMGGGTRGQRRDDRRAE